MTYGAAREKFGLVVTLGATLLDERKSVRIVEERASS